MLSFKSIGKNPAGVQLERLKRSSHFKGGMFHNINYQGINLIRNWTCSKWCKIVWQFMNKPAYARPTTPIPSIKTDLKNLPDNKPILVWLGHSSFLLKINNKHILVDPVFSEYIGLFKYNAFKNFDGSNVYTVQDMPPIDILIITHDHYDHLDYHTVLQLDKMISKIVMPLGVSSHFDYWGIDNHKIIELDWHESFEVLPGIQLTATPAQHYSGRSFKRFTTLWSSFIVESMGYKIYMSGDSGYDFHFKKIGDMYGPFDIALLESGQYNKYWPAVHMFPEQTLQAALDLNAKIILPIHWGKFPLSFHSWNELIEKIVNEAKKLQIKLTTPMIGELVIIDTQYPQTIWWRL